MYYTVWDTARRGYHKQTDQEDRVVSSPRSATQFATWCQATGRAGELMTHTGDRHTVEVHDWIGGDR